MDAYFVISVGKAGSIVIKKYYDMTSAELAYEGERLRVDRNEIVGVGFDQQTETGTIHPQQAWMHAHEADAFLTAVKNQRQHGYPDDPADSEIA